MFKEIPVRISFVCTNTTLGSFGDLTSSDGREHIVREGFRHYLICRAPRIIFESFDRTQKIVAIKVQRDVKLALLSVLIGAFLPTSAFASECETARLVQVDQSSEIFGIVGGYAILYANNYTFKDVCGRNLNSVDKISKDELAKFPNGGVWVADGSFVISDSYPKPPIVWYIDRGYRHELTNAKIYHDLGGPQEPRRPNDKVGVLPEEWLARINIGNKISNTSDLVHEDPKPQCHIFWYGLCLGH